MLMLVLSSLKPTLSWHHKRILVFSSVLVSVSRSSFSTRLQRIWKVYYSHTNGTLPETRSWLHPRQIGDLSCKCLRKRPQVSLHSNRRHAKVEHRPKHGVDRAFNIEGITLLLHAARASRSGKRLDPHSK